MIVKIDKSLEKDVYKISNKTIRNKLARIIFGIQDAEKLGDIPNLKKLKGASNYYRIRLGDYRLGLIIEKKQVQIIRLIHRKDMYKHFP